MELHLKEISSLLSPTFSSIIRYFTKKLYILIFLKTLNSEFSYIEVWFTDQNSKPLEIDKTNITLVIN